MLKKIILITLILFPLPVFSSIKIFMHAKAVLQDDELYVRDIAHVKGIGEKYDNIRNLKIDAEIYRDYYIDRKELFTFINKSYNQKCFIYGNAVRIFSDGKDLDGKIVKKSDIFFVAKGDVVSIVMRRKSISIEMLGVSRVNARVGDRVTVELNNGKLFKGILSKNKIVEVVL